MLVNATLIPPLVLLLQTDNTIREDGIFEETLNIRLELENHGKTGLICICFVLQESFA